jgi:hypothetical protein
MGEVRQGGQGSETKPAAWIRSLHPRRREGEKAPRCRSNHNSRADTHPITAHHLSVPFATLDCSLYHRAIRPSAARLRHRHSPRSMWYSTPKIMACDEHLPHRQLAVGKVFQPPQVLQ